MLRNRTCSEWAIENTSSVFFTYKIIIIFSYEKLSYVWVGRENNSSLTRSHNSLSWLLQHRKKHWEPPSRQLAGSQLVFGGGTRVFINNFIRLKFNVSKPFCTKAPSLQLEIIGPSGIRIAAAKISLYLEWATERVLFCFLRFWGY